MGRFSRVSPALAVSPLALSVSRGGVGWAATALPKGSVGPAQLRKDAVSTQKVRNASLHAVDFKPGQIPAGPPIVQEAQGVEGDQGDKGDTGAIGLSGYEIVKASNVVNASFVNSAVVECPSGRKTLGGGVISSLIDPESPYVIASFPTPEWDRLAGFDSAIGTRPLDAHRVWTVRKRVVTAYDRHRIAFDAPRIDGNRIGNSLVSPRRFPHRPSPDERAEGN